MIVSNLDSVTDCCLTIKNAFISEKSKNDNIKDNSKKYKNLPVRDLVLCTKPSTNILFLHQKKNDRVNPHLIVIIILFIGLGKTSQFLQTTLMIQP